MTRIFFALLATLLVAAMSFGQGKLKNGGTFTNTGTVTFKEVQNFKSTSPGTIVNAGTFSTSSTGTGDFVNTGTADGIVQNFSGASHGTIVIDGDLNNNAAGAVFDNDNNGVGVLQITGAITNAGTFDTDSGKVEYNGGAQAVLTTTYGALVASETGNKTIGGSVTVNDSARIAGTTLDVGAQLLTMKGSTFTLQNSGVLGAASGTVDYAGDKNQEVVATTYGSLTLSGSTLPRIKTATGNVTLAASGALTVGSDDTLYVTGNLDLSNSSVTLTNNEAIKVGGDATFVGSITNAGSFYYAGSSSQTIGAITYSDLRLGDVGAKNFPSGTVAVTGNYTIDGGTGARDYTSNSNTFSFAGNSASTQTISGLAETFYILDFSGDDLKNLGGSTLGASRMDISSGSGTVTNDVTTVTLSGIGTTSLTLASGTTLVNNASKTIKVTGGDIENDGTITNAGTIDIQ